MGPGAIILLGLAKVAAVVTAVKIGKQSKRIDKQANDTKKHKKRPLMGIL